MTSTYATPAGPLARPTRKEHDDHRTRSLARDDDPAPARPLAPAPLDRGHARPAGDLAAALRSAVQAGRRHPGLRRWLLRRLPDARRGRDDGALLQRLAGNVDHR